LDQRSNLRALYQQRRSNGHVGTLHAYPGTYHKFDDPTANKYAHVNGHIYTLRYNPQAAADAHDRVLAFFKQYL